LSTWAPQAKEERVAKEERFIVLIPLAVVGLKVLLRERLLVKLVKRGSPRGPRRRLFMLGTGRKKPNQRSKSGSGDTPTLSRWCLERGDEECPSVSM